MSPIEHRILDIPAFEVDALRASSAAENRVTRTPRALLGKRPRTATATLGPAFLARNGAC
jgi:hypothetical protein